MSKKSKSLKLLFGIFALGISGCVHEPVEIKTVSEKPKSEDVINIKEEGFNPITNEIKSLAASKTPRLDPKTVIISKQNTYDYQNQDYKAIDLQSIDVANREDHTLIYLFQGEYSEGYQGEYFDYFANIYLWDDGFLTGISNGDLFKGYWYNDENGDGVISNSESLGMVCDPNEFERYSSIEVYRADYFYDWALYLDMNIGRNVGSEFHRDIIVSGFMYYEPIAIAIDTYKTGTEFNVGDSFDVLNWGVVEIYQNLKYGYVFERSDKENMQLKWTIPEGLIVEDTLAKKGTFEIKASFNHFEASATIVVK